MLEYLNAANTTCTQVTDYWSPQRAHCSRPAPGAPGFHLETARHAGSVPTPCSACRLMQELINVNMSHGIGCSNRILPLAWYC
jgi:hypothetical protein